MMWLNGQLIENGAVNASGAGVALGWGVFTTLGIREGEPRFLSRHVARLKRDARTADVPFDLDFATVARGLGEVLESNRVRNGLARLTLSRRGDGRWNHENGADFSILAMESAPSQNDLRVEVSPFRIEAKRPLCGVKTTSYLPYLWAWRAAKARGFDEAILCDGQDFLSEGARSTLFWTKNEVFYTPSLETGCLVGIGRELTIEWAKTSGMEVRKGRFEAREIENATEIWLVSAAVGPRFVASWHDENGIERVVRTQNVTCAAFGNWFEAQSE